MPPKAQYQYILVRGDLSPGLQIAQACHASLDFAITHPDKARKWRDTSNYLCILNVKDETELLDYATLAHTKGAKHVLFHDPDVPLEREEHLMVGSYTALAVEPGDFHRHLSSLPLALRQEVAVR